MSVFDWIEMAKGIARLTSDAQAVGTQVSGTATLIDGISAGLERVSKDASEMTASAEGTAAASALVICEFNFGNGAELEFILAIVNSATSRAFEMVVAHCEVFM